MPPASNPSPFISLEKESGSNYWRATWHLDRPTRELRFERRSAFRSGVFEILTPGFTMERDGDTEVLRTAGQPVQTITARFAEFDRELVKEYEFFQTFSDGSVAIYTGHLVARPTYETEPADCDSCFIRTFRFIAPPSTRAMVDGRFVPSPFNWRDDEKEGTYVYFGSIEPIESKDMIAIIDPAMPGWLEDETRRVIPQLFALYTERFGEKLRERPTVLFNYEDSGSSGYSTSGGTLPGLIQLTVDGAAWTDRSDSALQHLFHFLAHESVHLWNGQLINYPDTEDSWMHEGSADALAERTMLDLGIIDRQAFLEYQTTAINTCRKGLASFPLRDAAGRGAFQLYYSCGNAIALFTESAITEKDLFGFWNRLINRVVDSGRASFDAGDYFAVLKEAGARDGDVERLRKFVGEQATPDELVSMLASHGVVIREEATPPRGYGQSVARDALLRILQEHCNGQFGFNATPNGFLLTKTNDCGVIPAGAIVTSIGGEHVLRAGHRAWEVLHERCGTELPITLALDVDGAPRSVDVVCKKPAASLPPYVRVVELPSK